MASLNRIAVIGNLGTEPEMRFTPSGQPVTSFRVATNRVYTTPEGERKEETTWFKVVAWGKQAESCNQFLTKGSSVYVEGSIKLNQWEGEDGQARSNMEITANQVVFLSRKEGIGSNEDKLEPEGEIPF